MQGRNTDPKVENGFWTHQGKDRVGKTKNSKETYTLPC